MRTPGPPRHPDSIAFQPHRVLTWTPPGAAARPPVFLWGRTVSDLDLPHDLGQHAASLSDFSRPSTLWAAIQCNRTCQPRAVPEATTLGFPIIVAVFYFNGNSSKWENT